MGSGSADVPVGIVKESTRPRPSFSGIAKPSFYWILMDVFDSSLVMPGITNVAIPILPHPKLFGKGYLQ
jgi:hypothetical protein